MKGFDFMNKRISKIVLQRTSPGQWKADVTYLQRHPHSTPRECSVIFTLPLSQDQPSQAQYEICLILDCEYPKTAIFAIEWSVNNNDTIWTFSGEYC